MRFIDSVMPDRKFSCKLSETEERVLFFVSEHWPCSALELAVHFNADVSSLDAKRRASSKYSYYLKKLVDRRLVLSKRFGHALVVWPLHAEKLRVVHDILKEKSF